MTTQLAQCILRKTLDQSISLARSEVRRGRNDKFPESQGLGLRVRTNAFGSGRQGGMRQTIGTRRPRGASRERWGSAIPCGRCGSADCGNSFDVAEMPGDPDAELAGQA